MKKELPKDVIKVRGIAKFPKLNTPDEFKGARFYAVTLELDPASADKVNAKLLEMAKEYGAEKGLKVKEEAVKLDVDEKTGKTVIKARANAEIKRKGTGEVIKMELNLIDADTGKGFTDKINSGADLGLLIKLLPYCNDAKHVGVQVGKRLMDVVVFKNGESTRLSAAEAFGIDSSDF